MKNVNPNSCCICGRELTDPVSIARGSGDDCAAKRAAFLASCGGSDEMLTAIAASNDPDVSRYARFILADMRNGNKRSAAHWFGAARLKMGSAWMTIEQTAAMAA